jgi:hypothetical protein
MAGSGHILKKEALLKFWEVITLWNERKIFASRSRECSFVFYDDKKS